MTSEQGRKNYEIFSKTKKDPVNKPISADTIDKKKDNKSGGKKDG